MQAPDFEVCKTRQPLSQKLTRQLEQVASPPADGISALSFSTQADVLAVSSWDNAVSFMLYALKFVYLF